MDSLFDILLGKSLSGGGGGGGGTSNYNALENKPSINSVTLTGNKSLSDLGIAAASDIPTVNNGTLTIQKNGTTVNTFKANQSSDVTVNITVPTTAADVSALPSSTKYAAALSLTINSNTYVVTGQLKDQNGNNLGSAQTIDLPLETMVVGGSYDAENKKIVLTLKNGNTVDIPVADLISGLQTELSATNKLNPAYINYDSTHAAVTDAEKTTWSGKQDALTFDGTYSASTNKAATVSTVTNAINALDVTGASGISAAKTISAWSETNGKVSISTQDIAIAGTQAVLTGYQKSTTAGQAVAATDNVNQAIGKVEKRVSDNENNILMLNSNGGGINDLEYDTLDTSHANGCTYTVNADKSITINRTEASANFSYAIFKIDNTAIDVKALCDGNHYLIGTPEGGFSTSFRMYATGGNYLKTDYGNGVLLDVPETTANINVIIRVEAGYQANNLTFKPMIITKADYDAGYKGYQPYALSNAELTNNISYIACANPFTIYADDSVELTGAGFIIPEGTAVNLPKGEYVLSFTASTARTGTLVIDSGATEVYRSSINIVSGSNVHRFTISADCDAIRFASSASITITNLMIVSSIYYDSGQTEYIGETMTNAAITPALKECVDNGAKNKIFVDKLNTTNANGVTYTINSDGTITVNGTPSGSSPSYAVVAMPDGGTYKNFAEFCNGDNILSGCPTGGSSSKYRMYITGTGYTREDFGNGVELTDTSVSPLYLIIYIYNGYTATNLTFKPMICSKSAWDVSQKYVPYVPTNAELTAKEQANENNISLKQDKPTVLKDQTTSIGTDYTLVDSLTQTITSGKLCRISAALAYRNYRPRGLILSYSNDSSDFDTTDKLINKSETTENKQELNVSAIITNNNVSIYVWAKAATAGMERLYSIKEVLGDI